MAVRDLKSPHINPAPHKRVRGFAHAAHLASFDILRYRNSVMIDIADLRKRPEAYKDAVKKKRLKVDIDAFLKLDEERRALIPDVEEMRKQKRKSSPI